jgi:hypothetical protein
VCEDGETCVDSLEGTDCPNLCVTGDLDCMEVGTLNKCERVSVGGAPGDRVQCECAEPWDAPDGTGPTVGGRVFPHGCETGPCASDSPPCGEKGRCAMVELSSGDWDVNCTCARPMVPTPDEGDTDEAAGPRYARCLHLIPSPTPRPTAPLPTSPVTPQPTVSPNDEGEGEGDSVRLRLFSEADCADASPVFDETVATGCLGNFPSLGQRAHVSCERRAWCIVGGGNGTCGEEEGGGAPCARTLPTDTCVQAADGRFYIATCGFTLVSTAPPLPPSLPLSAATLLLSLSLPPTLT